MGNTSTTRSSRRFTTTKVQEKIVLDGPMASHGTPPHGSASCRSWVFSVIQVKPLDRRNLRLYILGRSSRLVPSLKLTWHRPWKIGLNAPKGKKLVFQASIFRCELLVSGRVMWLGSPPFASHKKAIWKGSHNPFLRGLTITMVINHLLTGMILQAPTPATTPQQISPH